MNIKTRTAMADQRLRLKLLIYMQIREMATERWSRSTDWRALTCAKNSSSICKLGRLKQTDGAGARMEGPLTALLQISRLQQTGGAGAPMGVPLTHHSYHNTNC